MLGVTLANPSDPMRVGKKVDLFSVSILFSDRQKHVKLRLTSGMRVVSADPVIISVEYRGVSVPPKKNQRIGGQFEPVRDEGLQSLMAL